MGGRRVNLNCVKKIIGVSFRITTNGETMPKQPELLLLDYPKNLFKPVDPMFIGRGSVLRKSFDKTGEVYEVDLLNGECTCQWGNAYVWLSKDQKWIPNKYCTHKMKAIASIVQKQADKGNDLTSSYIKALATRYNVYEVVSTFHKELRRGDRNRAWFFACILSAKRGMFGVIKYMSNVVYEETRDHDLAEYLFKLKMDKESITSANICKAVEWFCIAPKKWEMPHRWEIFFEEMQAYKQLVKEYGTGVASGKGAASPDHFSDMLIAIERGFKERDLRVFQYGVKGGLKTTAENPRAQQAYRLRMLEVLTDLADVDRGYFFGEKAAKDELRYHDINVVADLAWGEDEACGVTTKSLRKIILNRPTIREFPLGKYPNIPLYAQDNHTWYGKSLIRRFPRQIDPGQEQTDIDFRWCGAYHGLSWRYQAFAQFKSCDVLWEQVKMHKGINRITQQLFY